MADGKRKHTGVICPCPIAVIPCGRCLLISRYFYLLNMHIIRARSARYPTKPYAVAARKIKILNGFIEKNTGTNLHTQISLALGMRPPSRPIRAPHAVHICVISKRQTDALNYSNFFVVVVWLGAEHRYDLRCAEFGGLACMLLKVNGAQYAIWFRSETSGTGLGPPMIDGCQGDTTTDIGSADRSRVINRRHREVQRIV